MGCPEASLWSQQPSVSRGWMWTEGLNPSDLPRSFRVSWAPHTLRITTYQTSLHSFGAYLEPPLVGPVFRHRSLNSIVSPWGAWRGGGVIYLSPGKGRALSITRSAFEPKKIQSAIRPAPAVREPLRPAPARPAQAASPQPPIREGLQRRDRRDQRTGSGSPRLCLCHCLPHTLPRVASAAYCQGGRGPDPHGYPGQGSGTQSQT